MTNTGQNYYGLAARRVRRDQEGGDSPPPRTFGSSASTPEHDYDEYDYDSQSESCTNMSDILQVLGDDTSSTISSVSFLSLTSDAILLADAGAVGILQVQGPQPDEEPTDRPSRPARMPVVKEQDPSWESSTEEEGEELDTIELGPSATRKPTPPVIKTWEHEVPVSKCWGCSTRRLLFIGLTVLCLIGATVIAINALSSSSSSDNKNETTPSKMNNDEEPTATLNESRPPTITPTTMSPTSAPTSYETRWMSLIASTSPSTSRAWNNETSTQAMALQWLVNTTNETETDERILQRYAMATLYYSTNEETWNNHSRWLDVDDECQWQSTTCDENGLIVGLNFTQNHLSGSIPEELALLAPSLVTLDFSFNNLTGTLPTTIGNLTLLATLNLQANDLTGSLPSQLGQLIQLQVLNVMQNAFSGRIPTSLDNLNAATQVYLSQTGLFGSADAFCDNEGMSDLWADCYQVSCACCTVCCYDQLGSCIGV